MNNLFIRYGRNRNDIVRETVTFSLFSIFLFSVAIFVPSMQFLVMFVPALFTVLTFRNGILPSIVAIFLSAIATFSITNAMDFMFALLVFQTMGLIVGEIHYRKNDMMSTIMIGTIIIVANFGLGIYTITKMSDMSWVDFMINSVFRSIENNQIRNMLNTNMFDLRNYIRSTFPATIISMSFFLGLVNYFVSGKIIKRMEPSNKSFRPFYEFALPGSLFIASLITIAGVLVVSEFIGYSTEILEQNLTFIYSVLFFMQGLSFIDFFLLRDKKPFIRTFVLFAFVFSFFLYPVFIITGAMEGVFNFRRLEK